jgi:hypothetical protein
MINRRMAEKLQAGEAIDVEKIGHPTDDPAVFELSNYQDDVDYCIGSREQWIWTIGREIATGRILAATDARFYEDPAYECLWLR